MSGKRGVIIGSAGLIVLISAVFIGLFVIKSPVELRREKLDQRRMTIMREIMNNFVDFVDKNGQLPERLDLLGAELGHKVPIADPVTNTPFAYTRIDKTTFRLCADFLTDTREQTKPGFIYFRNKSFYLAHPAGHHCFEFTLPEKEGAK